jgi:hypothetical protein
VRQASVVIVVSDDDENKGARVCELME